MGGENTGAPRGLLCVPSPLGGSHFAPRWMPQPFSVRFKNLATLSRAASPLILDLTLISRIICAFRPPGRRWVPFSNFSCWAAPRGSWLLVPGSWLNRKLVHSDLSLPTYLGHRWLLRPQRAR